MGIIPKSKKNVEMIPEFPEGDSDIATTDGKTPTNSKKSDTTGNNDNLEISDLGLMAARIEETRISSIMEIQTQLIKVAEAQEKTNKLLEEIITLSKNA